MMRKIDCDSYLETLGIATVTLSLEFVEALQKKHLAHFSFNNITVLLGNEISLELEDISQKIVLDKRGGYCFEHNKLFYEVLQTLGFDVRFVLGRVLLTNEDIHVPKTHRVTILTFKNEQYLLDVGFGSLCPTQPLNLQASKPNPSYEITKDAEDTLTLKLLAHKSSLMLYTFDLRTYFEADCTMGNFYSSHYKHAAFVNNAVVSLIQEDAVHSFRNNIYHIIKKNSTDVNEINSVQELQKLFQETFSLILSEEEAKIVFDKGHKNGKTV